VVVRPSEVRMGSKTETSRVAVATAKMASSHGRAVSAARQRRAEKATAGAGGQEEREEGHAAEAAAGQPVSTGHAGQGRAA